MRFPASGGRLIQDPQGEYVRRLRAVSGQRGCDSPSLVVALAELGFGPSRFNRKPKGFAREPKGVARKAF